MSKGKAGNGMFSKVGQSGTANRSPIRRYAEILNRALAWATDSYLSFLYKESFPSYNK
jgi:hypothetical protein